MSETQRLLSCPVSTRDYSAALPQERQPSTCKAGVLRWIAHLYDRCSTSLYLENTGSVARDHLANERTFLAWLRTSLSTISVGVGITQLFRLDVDHRHDTSLIGVTFIVMGMVFLVFACARFFHAQTAMTQGYFPASRGAIITVSSATMASFIALLAVMLQPR